VLDGQPALVFLLNAGSIQFTGQYEKTVRDGFFCNGILENTYLEKMPPGTCLLVVKFTADGWNRLRPLLSGTVAPIVPLAEVVSGSSALLLLLQGLRGTRSPLQQQHLLNVFLEQQLPDDIMGNYLLQSAAQMIRHHKGKITVSAICAALKVNYKWLERNFRIATGVTPKSFISNIRFLHAWMDVQQAAQPLTGIALDNGYYDQNHFIKVYRKYTGMLPSATK